MDASIAERSKAPVLRSGIRDDAWVRIPLDAYWSYGVVGYHTRL